MDKIRESIDQILLPYKEGICPGCAVFVESNNEVIYKKTFGYAELEPAIPVTEKTNFRIASITKQFTAVAIMMLTEEGHLSLETRLAEILPEIPSYANNVTLFHLLTHTSGILDCDKNTPTEYASEQLYDEVILEILTKQEKLDTAPGELFTYNDSGYSLLRVIIERISGKTFDTFLKEKIFLPLRMLESTTNNEGVTKISNRAYGYSRESSTWTKTDQSRTSTTIGDGGIYSSLHDMVLWKQAVLENKLLSKEMWEFMFTKHATAPNIDKGVHYGLGFFIKEYNGEKVMYHTGSSIGFKTCIYLIPSKGISVLFLSNRTDGEMRTLCEHIVNTLW